MPLQLNFLHLISLSIESNLHYDPSKGGAEHDNVDLDFQFLESKTAPSQRALALFLEVNTDRKDFESNKYRITARFFTEFDYSDMPTEALEFAKYIPNMLAIAYSVCRGILASCTASGSNGVFYLPILNFHKIVVDKAKSILLEKEKEKVS